MTTLADDLIREWSRPRYRHVDKNNWLASHVAQARKFVIDEGMSAFMADLGYVSLNACKTPAARHHLVESMRKLARLPHALTWIEYDKQAHRKRVKEAYHPDIVAEADSVPDRSGWLLMQHPKLETAFMALHCSSHSWDDVNARQALPNAGQFAYAWSSDDTIPPWPRDSFYHQDQPCRLDPPDPQLVASPAGILTGVLEYKTNSFSVIPAPYITAKADDLFKRMAHRYFNPLGELAHDARYLWSSAGDDQRPADVAGDCEADQGLRFPRQLSEVLAAHRRQPDGAGQAVQDRGQARDCHCPPARPSGPRSLARQSFSPG